MKKVPIILILILLIIASFFIGKLTINKPKSTDTKPKFKLCARTERYQNLPEFDRALSLIQQRITTNLNSVDEYTKNYYNGMRNTLNCVVVKYDNVNEKYSAEGVFFFDKNTANENVLPIYVDNSYKESDPILTAILLMHESTHAMQFIEELNFPNSSQSCFDKETAAFYSEYELMKSLSKEEMQSISSRAMSYWTNQDYFNSSPQIQHVFWLINDVIMPGMEVCGTPSASSTNCFNNYVNKAISDFVHTDPFYQKECLTN